MILISHRGNINGRIESLENSKSYIDNALSEGYDVEIDVWCVGGVIYLGHDNPKYEITLQWIVDRMSKLWIHCKNIESVIFFNNLNVNLNYFWHETDTVTLTSLNYIWSYSGKQPIQGSIAVLPEIHNENTESCIGICSDYIKNYK